ncbi:MAG: hypothetical protein MK116_06490 [Phycisphaerales bacterium]|nr:hypothetical protein [Phycisphaerales bacterium]
MKALNTFVLTTAIAALAGPAASGVPDPWADEVISHDPGIGGAPGYDNPATTLGPPEQYSGEGVDPGVVSPFQPAWTPVELVSIGAGGHLVLAFDEPIEDHPDNPFGIDLVIFGNAGFIDGAYPAGVVAGLFGADGGDISLSVDGITWMSVPDCLADHAWPTLAWRDVDPYAVEPGQDAADPLMPMDPALDWADLVGAGWEDVLSAYGQSAGGVGIDLASVSIDQVRFVRIDVAVDALLTPEIDAIVDIPPRLAADLDGDGTVGVNDLLLMLEAWGPVDPGDPGDVNEDGTVDVNDLLSLLKEWSS